MFLLEHDTIKDFKTPLLVGGFGQSKYVQDRLRKEHSGLTLIVPEEPGLAALKGAILFGINPRQVASRVMTYTYGIGVYSVFDANKHPIEKKVLINDQWKVNDVFKIFVKASEEVSVDQEVTQNTVPFSSVSLCTMYRTFSENPEYTTDPECELLGQLKMKNEDNVPLEKQEHKITFMFGNTELLVKVYNTFNGAEKMISLDFLQ
ncbi:hypothetical protein DPMN_022916 [Dreissena polymorpha]|uniref:Uncharacterized protein n=1 Tax=Dreissena polymorpha TaxID=45954 RepID=A0A9D4R9F7_DREPO|nr:hypothetical protein DPMN_022916 [Dreissena polymorpha]